MVELIPNATRVTIPGAAHGVHLAQPEAAAKAVAEFLADLS
jgi:pimeloyl-ACP methyl ester carboxylesterase